MLSELVEQQSSISDYSDNDALPILTGTYIELQTEPVYLLNEKLMSQIDYFAETGVTNRTLKEAITRGAVAVAADSSSYVQSHILDKEAQEKRDVEMGTGEERGKSSNINNVNEDLKFIGDDTLVVVDGICLNIDRKIEEQFAYFMETGIIFDSLEDVMNRGIIPSIFITSLTENQVVDSIVRLNISSSTMTPTVLNNNIEGSEDTAALLNHPTILTYELFTNI